MKHLNVICNKFYYTGSKAGQGLKIVPQTSTPNRQPSPTPVFRPASTTQPAKVKPLQFFFTIVGSDALSSKMLLGRIVENIKIDAYFTKG